MCPLASMLAKPSLLSDPLRVLRYAILSCSMFKWALVWTFHLLYHIWHGMQQIPHQIIYALHNMSYHTSSALRMHACATMAPMEKAFLAIWIPV
jgi:hypothetical protein